MIVLKMDGYPSQMIMTIQMVKNHLAAQVNVNVRLQTLQVPVMKLVVLLWVI